MKQPPPEGGSSLSAMAEETLTAPRPTPTPSSSLRVRHALRRRENWREVMRFGVVGLSGYAVNLGVFALAVAVLDMHHLIGATLAFMVAVSNNFWWNRHWTFAAGDGHAGLQAARYMAVNLASFVLQAATLEVLVSGADMPEISSQALSVAVVTPFNFVANKVWSFGRGVRRVS